MKTREWIFLALLTGLAALVTFGAIWDVYQVAWGTGIWLGEFSLKWAFLFFIFLLSGLALFILTVAVLWRPDRFTAIASQLARFRNRLGWLRWLLIACLLLAPVWWFQFTYWGVVFTGIGFRLLVWALILLACACFIPASGKELLTWPSILAAAVLSSAVFLAAIPLRNVTSYPFSLGWSEGNRLWDYSILFGRARYIYSASQPLSPFLEIGRQFIGGLPFLYSGLTIEQARLWQGLMGILPYIALGLASFQKQEKNLAAWLLAGLWSFIFLRQGPIHTPLVVAAFFVAISWRRPLWLAVPLIAAASWFAAVSRFTWAFAPAIWVGMLTLVASPLENGRLPTWTWFRTISLALAGLLGGLILPSLTGGWMQFAEEHGAVANVSSSLTRQPLLWYRLLPNSTYNLGIVINLFIAVVPLIVVLIFLSRQKFWSINLWQKLAILAPLAAFLFVGLVASVKIGGGADLHNLDMFLIGLSFCAGIVWEKTHHRWLTESAGLPRWMLTLLILLVALPAWSPLLSLRPLLYTNDFERLKRLTDITDPYANPRVLGLLPPRDEVDDALMLIREEVAEAQTRGDILFMDQRQLLTFGYVNGVPLIPEYEKKYLMDQAMGATAAYTFPPFYRDLAAHRFALIISDPLKVPIKDSDYSFGEENNAWVKWVSNPVLCYYEPKVTLNQFGIQLLTPRSQPLDCTLP